MATDASSLGFDPDALRAKYRAERDKRLRADGNEQYREVKGELAHFVEDPYVAPGFTREPLTDEVDVVVIGGGFGGLLAGARLREAGIANLRLIEKAGDFGGTWYWNRYPGAQCDVESYIYLPLLEELGYVPKEKYSRAPELDRRDEPRRPHAGALRVHVERPAEPAQAAGDSGHRVLPRRPRTSRRAGTGSAWTTSTSWSRVASRPRTWSATAGPTSSGSCW